MAKDLKCGSKIIWTVLFIMALVVGLILIIVPSVVGGCSCSSACDSSSGNGYGIRSGSDECTEVLGGCESGSFNADACANAIVVEGKACSSVEACQYGGMSMAAFATMHLFGWVFVILSCVFCCGIVPCCCFAGPEINSAAV